MIAVCGIVAVVLLPVIQISAGAFFGTFTATMGLAFVGCFLDG